MKDEQEVVTGKREEHPRKQEQHEQGLRGTHIFRLGSRWIRVLSHFEQQALFFSLLVRGNLNCYPKKLSRVPMSSHAASLLLHSEGGVSKFRVRTTPQSLLLLLVQVLLSFPFS